MIILKLKHFRRNLKIVMDEGDIIIFIILYSSPISVQRRTKTRSHRFRSFSYQPSGSSAFLLNKVLIPSTAMITANTTIGTISTH